MPLTASPSVSPSTLADSPRLRQVVLQTVTALLPSIVQTVQEQLGLADDEPAEPDDDPAAADDVLSDDAPDEDDDVTLPVELPEDELRHQYSAMSAECQRAYRAGWKRGAVSVQRYSRHGDLHKVVARQQVRLQELSDQITRERRDADRYSKLSELSREFAFDPREEAETCRDMTDKQFDRHCTATIVKYARRDDVTNVELFSDPTVRVDQYGGSAGRATAQQIERYSREAAAIAARKNASRRGSTTFETEFDQLCKQHGITG